MDVCDLTSPRLPGYWLLSFDWNWWWWKTQVFTQKKSKSELFLFIICCATKKEKEMNNTSCARDLIPETLGLPVHKANLSILGIQIAEPACLWELQFLRNELELGPDLDRIGRFLWWGWFSVKYCYFEIELHFCEGKSKLVVFDSTGDIECLNWPGTTPIMHHRRSTGL